MEVRVTKRERDETGFKPLPLRWRIEAAFGTPGDRRHRLARNLEQSPAAAEDAVSIASCYRLLRACHRPDAQISSSNRLYNDPQDVRGDTRTPGSTGAAAVDKW